MSPMVAGCTRFRSLPIGRYTLSATQSGFKHEEVPPFILQAGQHARIDLNLVPGAATESVTVTDAAPLIQTDTSSIGQVIAVQQVSSLPLNSLHVAQLIQLTPGAITSPLVGSANTANGGPPKSSNNISPVCRRRPSGVVRPHTPTSSLMESSILSSCITGCNSSQPRILFRN